MNLDDLLSIQPPTRELEVAGFTFHLQALTSAELDDLITRHPPAKGSKDSFSDDMRYELVARTVTDLVLEADEVRKLFAQWGRGDVSALQDAVFSLNWRGKTEVPLSETD